MLECLRTIAGLAFGVLACAPAFGQDYVIKIDRPYRVGEQYRDIISVEETREFEISSQGTVIQQNVAAMKARVEADQSILAVDEKGVPTSFTYVIREWEGSLNGQPVTEVEKGMVIEVRMEGGKVSIRHQAGEFSPEVEQLLQTFLPGDADAKDKTGMDASFGTDARKKVGDSWPIDAAAAAKTLAETGVVADEKDVTGSVVLQNVHDIGGVPCMRLKATFNVNRFQSFEMEGATAKVLNGGAETVATFDLPVETSLPLVGASLTGKMNLDAEIATEQGPVQLKISGVAKRVGTITRIK